MKNEKFKIITFCCVLHTRIDDLYVTSLCGWRVSMNVLKYKRALMHCIALIQ